jgi:TetR/AcrR family transcriptional regulator, cholesterol catabolism regulator
MSKIITRKNGSKKDVITRKASALFRKKGFSATSMRDIAESIGIEAPSLYNHIQSKNEILIDLCFNMARLFTDFLKEVEYTPGSNLSKIESIIRFHISMMIDEFESVYISNHEWKHLPEPHLGEFKNQRRNYRLRLAAILQKGIDKKEIRRVNATISVHTILSAINGIEDWQKSGRKVDAKLIEENIIQILIEGLKNK